MEEKQELHCHNCNNYVQFSLDMSLNGAHVLRCPKCGHEHCRIVRDGKITAERWDSRNDNVAGGNVYQIRNATYSATSTYSSYRSSYNDSGTGGFFYNSWDNSTASSGRWA